MSWANLVKKTSTIATNSNLKTTVDTKETEQRTLAEELDVLPELSSDEYFDSFIRPKLFDRLVDIVLNCQNNRYSITDYVSTNDLMEFIDNYVDYSKIDEMLTEHNDIDL